MTIKTLLAPNKTSFWIAFLWTTWIVYLCLKAQSNTSFFAFPNQDKVAHFTSHFVFVLLWYRYLVYKNSAFLKNKIALAVSSIVFGIAIEFLQKYFTTTRHADVLDVVANIAGALFGIFSSIKFHNVINTKLPK